MIVEIAWKRIEVAHSIVSAIYDCNVFLFVGVVSIFGLVWQTEVISSSSFVAMMAACCEPLEGEITYQSER